MNRLLDEDGVAFVRNYPSAEAFLVGAHLRYELYCLLLHVRTATDWKKKRTTELLTCPGCNEPWFLALVRKLCPWHEHVLHTTGLQEVTP